MVSLVAEDALSVDLLATTVCKQTKYCQSLLLMPHINLKEPFTVVNGTHADLGKTDTTPRDINGIAQGRPNISIAQRELLGDS